MSGWTNARSGHPTPGKPSPQASTDVSRGDLLRRGAAVGTSLLASGVVIGGLATPAASAPSAEQDRSTLEYLLELEELQAAFYAEALKTGSLKGELREYARVVGEHEREHVAYLRKALGGGRKAQAYDFGDATSTPKNFKKTAVTLEETGLGAYTGAAVRLTADTLRDAARIVSVEARHAAWARDLAGRPPAPQASDEPTSEQRVRAAVRDTGFVRPG